MPDEPQNQGQDLYIDGQKVTVDDLTFGEQRKMAEIIRSLVPATTILNTNTGEQRTFHDTDSATQADIAAAIIYVWKQRTNPQFTLDDALGLTFGDITAPPTEPKAKRPAPAK